MRIDRLTLKNFKGFESFELDLHPNCTVLVGTNGSGKTSVLDGLRVALGSWFLGFPDVAPVPIQPNDVHLKLIEHEPGAIDLEPSFPSRVETIGRHEDEEVKWARELRSSKGRTTYGEASSLQEHAERSQVAVSTGEASELPVLAYYGTDRLWRHKNANAMKGQQLTSRLQGYADSLDSGSDHKLLLAWMRRRTFIWLERVAGRSILEHLNGHDDPLLNAVKAPVVRCIATLMNEPPDDMEFSYDIPREDLVFSFGRHDWMTFSSLSDGYRNIIAMVADIAWRAVRLNPHAARDFPEAAEGVVLIDEVALHLHPGWQMKVLPALRAAFPNIQFVVTTHSPQVLTSVEPECVRFLQPGKEALTPNVSKGLDVNTVLRDLMGVPTRPPEIQKLIDDLSEAIDEQPSSELESRIDELAALLGHDDPTVTGLRWELKLAAGE